MMMRIKDQLWVMFKILLQLEELREIYISPVGSLQITLLVIEEVIMSTYKKAEISSKSKK